MKKSLLLLAVCLYAVPAFGQNLTAKQERRKELHQQPQRGVVVTKPANGEGSVQWAARQHNPLQALSPFAASEYGDGTDFVVTESEYDPFQRTPAGKPRGRGVRLFGFTF